MKRAFLATLIVAFVAACSSQPVRPTAPVTVPGPASSSNQMTPFSTVPVIAAPIVRVGLASDQSTFAFPRLDGGYVIVSSKGASLLKRGFQVTAPLAGAKPSFAVQVAAVSDRASAQAYLDKVTATSGVEGTVVFDAASSLSRVVVGNFPEKAAADALREKLVSAGYPQEIMVVSRATAAQFEKVIKLTDDEGIVTNFAEPYVVVFPATAPSIPIGDSTFRGAARVFINSRGLLNIINDLNLEDYVRGVVPNEMGPKTFDELEAIKAQALAARTYVAARLREYVSEGYDICASPVCQVYKGLTTEDPLSNQAVKETEGRIITYDGKPIDALFTSTCGGETSDVGVMFPGRTDPYLKRVRCVELEMLQIAGRTDSGLLTEMEGDARLFLALAAGSLPDQSHSWSGRDVAAAVAAANQIAGYDVAKELGDAASAKLSAPVSSRRRDVLNYLDAVWGVGEFGDTLTLPEDRTYFFPQSLKGDTRPYSAAAFLLKYRITPTQSLDRVNLDAAMPRDELYALLYSWLRKLSVVTETSGKIEKLAGRDVTLKAEGKSTSLTLPDGVPVYRKLGERLQEYRMVPVMIGDRMSVLQLRNRPLAAVIQANYDGAAFDRTSSFSSWTRSYRADELVKVISKRNPIQKLVDLRPREIDASHRVASLDVIAENDRVVTLRGLVVRWSLNLPDNLFTFVKTTDPDGVDRYTFFGKGWGHGVGMCQVGAYGMAFRGWTADQIIKHYYTGVDIVPLASVVTTQVRSNE